MADNGKVVKLHKENETLICCDMEMSICLGSVDRNTVFIEIDEADRILAITQPKVTEYNQPQYVNDYLFDL